eukprot:XP_012815764.1 PREDICTED: vomeronasal type-2 receptor 26-like [Xenopus tropicalis]
MGCNLIIERTRDYFSQPGDIIIGGTFPVYWNRVYKDLNFTTKPPELHCERVAPHFYETMQALIFAVEEINAQPKLLSNITLGFQVFDTCFNLRKAAHGTLSMLSGGKETTPNYHCNKLSPLASIIGDSGSSVSIIMAQILGLNRYPQISYFATSPIFNNRYLFPSFFRTIPSDEFQMKGLAQLVSHFGWSWVGLLASDNDYGQFGLQLIRQEIINNGGCVAFAENILTGQPNRNAPRIVQLIRESTAKVVVVLDAESSFVIVLEELLRQNAPLSNCSPSCPPGFRKVMVTGKPPCCYECALCPLGRISNQTDAAECHSCSWDTWPNLQRDKCLLRTTEFLSYKEPLGYGLSAISIFSSLIPLVILFVFIYYKTTPVVRANNYSLSCLLLLSLFLCFLCSLGFIGYPQPAQCLLRQVAFGIAFSLCISCVLAKTITVVIAFNATKPSSRLRQWAGVRVSYCVIVLCTFIQLVICGIWLFFFPPFPELDIDTQPGIIIANCNEGSPTAFWCMLGYLGFLATISFIVAFLARRLPDSFNEAKFITFSMLAFLSVWVSFIPAYLSARGMYTVAMEVFAILSSSWTVKLCIFVPKCFIILFRPNMNSREHLMGKEVKNKKKG